MLLIRLQVKECGRVIGADEIVKACDTNQNRLASIMSSRDYAKMDYNAGRSNCAGVTRAAPSRRATTVPIRRDYRPPEEFERFRRERRERAQRQREEVIRRLEESRTAALVLGHDDDDDQVRGNDARAQGNDEGNNGAAGINPGRERLRNRAEGLLLADARMPEMLAGIPYAAAPPLSAAAPSQINVGRNGPLNPRPYDGRADNIERPTQDGNAARAQRNGAAADNNEASAQDDNAARAQRNGIAADNTVRSEQSNNVEQGTGTGANAETHPARNSEVANNNETSEQEGSRAGSGEVASPVREPRRNDRAAANDERAERVENRLPMYGRGDEDFSAAVARAAFPHLAEERRALLARALRNDDDYAVAIARRLDMEEEDLLWGPRLPARRRLMMAQRAVRSGRLDPLDFLEHGGPYDMIAHMEAMDFYDHYDGIMRPARRPPPRPVRPPEPTVPQHLRELRKLEASAKIEPFSVSEGLELVKPCPEFDAEMIFIKRVTACIGKSAISLILYFIALLLLAHFLPSTSLTPQVGQSMDSSLSLLTAHAWERYLSTRERDR